MIARGWATVELERAARELAGSLRPGTAFREAPDSVLLGARCLVGEFSADDADDGDGDRDNGWLVLMEPSTEGRISATLARHGEGWVATWEPASATDERDDGTPTWSAQRPGPLGPERLWIASPVFGPHRLVVTTATIEP